MLKTVSRVVAKVESALSLFILAFLVLGVLSRTLLRNVFSSGFALDATEWLTIYLPHGVLLLGLAGASIGLSKGKYIRLDLIASKLSNTASYWLTRCVALCCNFFFAFTLALCVYYTVFVEEVTILATGYLPMFILLFIRSLILFFEADQHRQVNSI